MLRAAFWFTALLLLPCGLFLYFMPASVAGIAGVSPLWLARVSGGLLVAWGAFQVAASVHPDGVKVGGLVGGNLLTVAAIVPAVIRTGATMPPALRTALLAVAAALAVLAVLALLTFPVRRSSL